MMMAIQIPMRTNNKAPTQQSNYLPRIIKKERPQIVVLSSPSDSTEKG